MNKFCALILLLLLSVMNIQSQTLETIYPKEGQYVSGQTHFEWETIENTSIYRLEVYQDAGMQLLSGIYSTPNSKQELNLTNGTYYWKVFALKNGSITDSSRLLKVNVIDPGKIDSIGLWLSSEQNISLQNNTINSWRNIIDTAIAAQQSSATKQPQLIVRALNGFPAVFFDKNDDQLDINYPINNSSFLIALVYNVHERTNRTTRLIDGQNNWLIGPYVKSYRAFNGSLIGGKVVIKDRPIVQTIFVKNDSTFNFINDSLYGQNVASYPPGNYISFGSNVGTNCSVLEMIILKGETTDSIRQSIDRYLMDKYSPPVNLGADRKVCSFPDSLALDIDYALDYQWSTGDTTDAIQIDSAGKYYVTITDMFERTSTDSIYIGKDTTDYKINFSFSDTTICKGDTISLQAPYSKRFTYQWNTADTTATIQAADAGQYVLNVQNCLNNSHSDTINVFVNQPKFSLGVDTIVCFNNTFRLSADSTFSNVDYLWSTNDTAASIIVDSSNNYHLTVTDQFACSYTDSIHVQVDSSLYNLSLGADTSLCAGNKVGLISQVDSTYKYLWNTGDTTAFIELDSSGSYHLTVTDSRCSITDSILVNIKGKAPTAAFSAKHFCYLDSVHFNDFSRAPSGDSIVSWKWNFQNGDSAFVPNPKHQFNAVQSYQLVLQVETDKGCIDTAQKGISIRPLPKADFVSNLHCSKKDIDFIDSSSISNGNIIGYLWNFGDSSAAVNSSNQKNPAHTYDTMGVYQVGLVVTSNFGCKDTLVKPKTVHPTPIVDFSFEGSCLGDSTYFFNQSSIAQGSIVDYLWLTNRQLLREENPSVLYENIGLNGIYLEVTSDSSCTAEMYQDSYIKAPPKANFSDSLFCENEPLQLYDQSVSNYLIKEWQYIFDNTDTSRKQNPIFKGRAAGTYPISMTVRDTNNCSDTTQKLIQIQPKPKAAFKILNNKSGVPYQLRVNNNSKNADQYIWDFGVNGDSLHAAEPTYLYKDSGEYMIDLVAILNNGCSDTVSHELQLLSYYLDAMLNKVVVTEDRMGEMKIQLQVINAGNNAIENLSIATNVDNGVRFVEELKGPIYRSDGQGYELQSRIQLGKNQSFICVQIISVNDTVDAIIENNEQCEAVVGNNDLYLNFYPNPTLGNINLEYVLPRAGDYTLKIVDQLGRIVFEKSAHHDDRGYYSALLKINNLRSGIYHYIFQFNNQKKHGTFIKQ